MGKEFEEMVGEAYVEPTKVKALKGMGNKGQSMDHVLEDMAELEEKGYNLSALKFKL